MDEIEELKKVLYQEKERAKKELFKREKFKGEILEKRGDFAILRLEKEVESGKTLGYFDDSISNFGYVVSSQGKEVLVKLMTKEEPEEFIESENLSLYDVQIEMLNRFNPEVIRPFSKKFKLKYNERLDKWQNLAFSATMEMGKGEFLLVIGPPGTGKTRFIVEAAKSVNKCLITAHTNRAVDNILQSFSKAVRIGYKRENLFEEIERLKEIRREIARAKVVGATLMKCAFFNFPTRFDYVFVDESSQANIAEVLSAVYSGERVVLVGDPYQLPPVLRCKKPERFSAFNFFYKISRKAVWLRTHYRSNPEIIGFSAKYIYGGKLKAHSSCRKISLKFKKSPQKFNRILNPKLPVVMLIVWGREERVGQSKINRREAVLSAELFRELTCCGIRDIGIITPYVEQRKLIKNFVNCEVNTVDAFQGREKDVIIYSTVSPGFSSNWRRFNVAVTRAKKKLIVISNVSILNFKNSLLYKFYEYAKSKNAVFVL